MRITNSMITNNYMNNLYNNLARLDKMQMQVSSNKRITKLSDDPIGSLSSMEARAKLNKLEQYQENVNMAITWQRQTESSALELNEIIKQAHETTVRLSNDYMSPDEKNAVGELIGQLRDHVITIGNAKSGDKYIFGGYNVNTPPFNVDAGGNVLYNGLDLNNAANPALIAEDGQVIEYEIGFNMKTQVSVTGSELMGMGPDNVYTVLDELYDALQSDLPADQISSFLDRLSACQSHILSVDADLGGRMSRLELIDNRYDEDIITYTQMKSKIEDVDIAEATMKYKMAEAVYIASLQIGTNIVQPTLVNFLQ